MSDGNSTKRRAACFTIVQNESYFLPKWIGHYEKHFHWPDNDLFVLDHDSTDQSTRDLSPFVKVVPVHRSESFNHGWLRDTVQSFQQFLLQSYECVVFTEVDELIVTEIGLGRLIGEFAESEKAMLRCLGVELVDRHGKISAERSHWYDKTLISKAALSWSQGFHTIFENWPTIPQPPIWPGLYLIHTHRADYAVCREKHRKTAARKWSEADIKSGAGAHNRIQTDEEFDKWFYRQDGPAIELPESILKQIA